MNGPTDRKYVFDTCAATFLVKDDKRMLDLLPDMEAGDWYVSVITRMELYAEPHMSTDKLTKVDRFLGYATVILLDDAVEKVAVDIRRDVRPKIKLPDCIVAATAIGLGATLLTDDTSLKALVWPGYTVQPL
jgi:predicted nucleic acid-binding protein